MTALTSDRSGDDAQLTTATCSRGRLSGVLVPGGVTAFLGVPYGAPPIGPLRFAPPVPPIPWSGTRLAVTHGAAPIQGLPSPGRFLADLSSATQSEDCLTLSLWTPVVDPQAKLPVMVFLHGGAFISGSNSVAAYDGGRLAARGVVVVTVNYRLGLFGWLRCEALDADGNQGLDDQRAALRWVAEEIGAFGGDPNNVTVFGESAGAASIAMHLAGDRHRMFGRAVLQSGSYNLVSTVAEADDTAARVLGHLEVSPAALRDLPTAALQAAQDEATPRSGGVFYRPVADGATVPVDVARALYDDGPDVAVLCGTNRDEMGFFWGREERFDAVSDEALTALIGRFHGDASSIVAQYRATRSGRGQPVDNRSVAIAAGSDWTFRAATMALAAWQSRHTAAYAYRLDYPSPLYGGLVGAAHVLDVPLVFGTFDHPSVAGFTGYDVQPEVVRAVSEDMAAAWVAFATDGDPGWARYDPTVRITRTFGGATATTADPEGDELRLWDPFCLHR